MWREKENKWKSKRKTARDNNELRINFLEHELIDFGFDMKYEALLVIALNFFLFQSTAKFTLSNAISWAVSALCRVRHNVLHFNTFSFTRTKCDKL